VRRWELIIAADALLLAGAIVALCLVIIALLLA
jgi:hypothetical protein